MYRKSFDGGITIGWTPSLYWNSVTLDIPMSYRTSLVSLLNDAHKLWNVTPHWYSITNGSLVYLVKFSWQKSPSLSTTIPYGLFVKLMFFSTTYKPSFRVGNLPAPWQRQCAAVKSHRLLMTDPEHLMKLAMDGNALRASVPLYTRVLTCLAVRKKVEINFPDSCFCMFS